MTDQNENGIIDEKDVDFPSGFEEMLSYALSYELSKRLCKDIEATDEYRMQLVHDLAKDTVSALRESRESDSYPNPKDYPRRYKLLINRMFRCEGENFIPFPEVDTPYERFRSRTKQKRRMVLRIVRVERRQSK